MRNLVAFIRSLFAKPVTVPVKREPVSPEYHQALQQAARRAVVRFWQERYQRNQVIKNLEKQIRSKQYG